MEIKKSYYAVVPATVRYDKKIIPSAKLLYGEITALCNERGFCWATNKYFADLYEVDARTIRRWVQSLIAQKHVRVEIVNETDRKIFILDPGQKSPTPGTKTTGEGGQKEPHNNTVNTTKKTRTLSAVADASFQKFWESYPKRELKKKSLEIWKAKNLSEKLPEILAFIEKAKLTDRWKKGFIKAPPVFMNGECWNDDLSSYNEVPKDKNFIKGSGPSEDAVRFMAKKREEERIQREKEEGAKDNDTLRKLNEQMKGLADSKRV